MLQIVKHYPSATQAPPKSTGKKPHPKPIGKKPHRLGRRKSGKILTILVEEIDHDYWCVSQGENYLGAYESRTCAIKGLQEEAFENLKKLLTHRFSQPESYHWLDIQSNDSYAESVSLWSGSDIHSTNARLRNNRPRYSSAQVRFDPYTPVTLEYYGCKCWDAHRRGYWLATYKSKKDALLDLENEVIVIPMPDDTPPIRYQSVHTIYI